MRVLTGIPLAFCLLSTDAMAECGSGKVINQEGFAAWGLSRDDPQISISGNTLVLTPAPAKGRSVISTERFSGDISVCVDFTVARTDNEDETHGGLVFWASDSQNYYTFQLSSGDFTVERRVMGKWLIPIDWTPADPAKKAEGETNTLEIWLKGKNATLLVNGEQVGELSGFPPEGSGTVGITGQSPTNSSATLKFSNFIVAETPPH
jgi:hypothetical protein